MLSKRARCSSTWAEDEADVVVVIKVELDDEASTFLPLGALTGSTV